MHIDYYPTSRIPAGGRSCPSGLVASIAHGLKLGVADGIVAAMESAGLLKDAQWSAGEQRFVTQPNAAHAFVGGVCSSLAGVLRRWHFENRVLPVEVVAVQEIQEDAGLGIFNR